MDGQVGGWVARWMDCQGDRWIGRCIDRYLHAWWNKQMDDE